MTDQIPQHRSIQRPVYQSTFTKESRMVLSSSFSADKLLFTGTVSDLASRAMLHASKVNLIITDYCMPGMTGYELLKKIKGSSCLKEIPVVVVLSENVPTRINKCLEEGAQMFMLKPLKQADVKKLRCRLMNCRSYKRKVQFRLS